MSPQRNSFFDRRQNIPGRRYTNLSYLDASPLSFLRAAEGAGFSVAQLKSLKVSTLLLDYLLVLGTSSISCRC